MNLLLLLQDVNEGVELRQGPLVDPSRLLRKLRREILGSLMMIIMVIMVANSRNGMIMILGSLIMTITVWWFGTILVGGYNGA